MKARISVTALMVLASVGVAHAQRADQAPAPPNNARFGDPTATARSLQGFVYGVVKKVEPSRIICDKTEFGDGEPFNLSKKTRFYRNGQPSSLSDLKAGDDIWVKIHRNKRTGELTALRVVSGVFPSDNKMK